ncbi:hypothetical protein BX600DRAFT_66032 [Xylariales sp. PMI_506]|nr:hypothetical protein BX600DRAFT_66032 [Xylariales sp. PMI_506]
MGFRIATGAIALVASSVLVSADFTIDPNSVPLSTRSEWCTSEISVCDTLCGSAATSNTCDATALTYTCTCSDGSTPAVDQYINTLPWFICEAAYSQCVESAGNDAAAQSNCTNTISAKCPTQPAQTPFTISSFPASTTTTASAATDSPTTGTAITTSSLDTSASTTASSAATATGTDVSTGTAGTGTGTGTDISTATTTGGGSSSSGGSGGSYNTTAGSSTTANSGSSATTSGASSSASPSTGAGSAPGTTFTAIGVSIGLVALVSSMFL